MSPEKILITGMPHCGKSTLLDRVITPVKKKQGFITREIPGKESGKRVGFEIVTASGEKTVLADVNSDSPIRVSRYGVKVENLEKIIPDLLSFEPGDVLYIDEIGQMELYSERFKELVRLYLESGNLFIATLSRVYSNEFMKEIASRPDVRIIEITPENRDEMTLLVKDLIAKAFTE